MNLSTIVNHALKQAEQSQHQHQHGCVIFRQGKILGRGFNKTNHQSRRLSEFRGYWAGSIHAEIAAIIHARCDLRGSSCCVVRLNRRNSRPCIPCMAALKEAGIKKVYYTSVTGVIEEKL